MIYLRYLSLVILGLLVSAANILLSPILPLFIRAGYLPDWLSWFQTADAPAWGDEAYHKREMAWADWLPYPLFLYISAVCWVCRNSGYGYDNWAGCTIKQPYDYEAWGNENANIWRDDLMFVRGVAGKYTRLLTNGDGKKYFEKCWVWESDGIWFRVQFGWHLHTIEAGRVANLKLTFNRW